VSSYFKSRKLIPWHNPTNPFFAKAHTAALRENGQFKTRLRIAERECKRREAEVQRLLSQSSWQSSTAPGGGPSPEHRLELAGLKRKLLLYERMLHEKGQENAFAF